MKVLAAVAALVLLTGCSSDDPAAPSAEASPLSERVSGTLDGVELVLEVADEDAERATGLMGRTSVPAGTGMVFLYDAPVHGRFYMYRVPIPLRATFIRDGRVVSTVVMPPCTEDDPGACPTYGADGLFDTVVETSPDELPDPEPGDPFVLDR